MRRQVREESRMSPGFLSHTPGQVTATFRAGGGWQRLRDAVWGRGTPAKRTKRPHLNSSLQMPLGGVSADVGAGRGGSLEPREEAEVEAAATSGARSPRESVREGKRGPGPTGVPTVLKPTKTKPGASGWLSG